MKFYFNFFYSEIDALISSHFLKGENKLDFRFCCNLPQVNILRNKKHKSVSNVLSTLQYLHKREGQNIRNIFNIMQTLLPTMNSIINIHIVVLSSFWLLEKR